MARLELRTFIQATPERIWSILVDFDGQKRWMADLRHLRITSAARQGVGTILEVTSELFRLPVVRDRIEVDSWQPPHEYTVVHTGRFTGTGGFRLDAVAGGTIFYWWEDFKPPLGPIGEFAFSQIVGPHMRRVFGRSMDNLRNLAENDPSTKPNPEV